MPSLSKYLLLGFGYGLPPTRCNGSFRYVDIFWNCQIVWRQVGLRNLRKRNLRNVDFRNIDLRNIDLRNIDLRNIDLRNIDFRNVDLRKWTFRTIEWTLRVERAFSNNRLCDVGLDRDFFGNDWLGNDRLRDDGLFNDWLSDSRLGCGRFCDLGGRDACGRRFCCCLLYTSPSPRDRTRSRMPSSA